MIDFSGITLAKVSEKEIGAVASFEIGPLPKGYGNTLGNAMRRVMLSSLEGAAITSVRINNLTHEYTTIPGVKQNVLDIVLRLKNVRVKMEGKESSTVLTLNKKGKGVIKAKDLTTSKGVEIVNGEYVIAEITDDSTSLNFEAIVEKGVGYKRADESLRDEIGRIPVDTIFSPVRLVEFTVLPTRKGSQADLDKVVMSITTDGTVSPEDAIAQAGGILRSFFGQTAVVFGSEMNDTPTSELTKMSDWTVAELGIDAKTVAKLDAAKISTLSDVAAQPKTFYSKDLKLTAKQVKELSELLDQYNLGFAKNAKKSKKA
ncbi:DNA-directed RNA polymerase subunit alpha [bacterium]|nr:DNA-directed RNA polymerase subunit alpha [bacterium]